MTKKAVKKPVSKNPIKKVETKPIKTVKLNITVHEFSDHREIKLERIGFKSVIDVIGILESVKMDLHLEK